MKRLYMIGGPMGVGKTTVSQILKRSLPNSIFLDGDWCWDAHPFCVTEETRSMVMDNICHLLNNFIHCSAYENIIFCWVMHTQAIIDAILAGIDAAGVEVRCISLVCDGDVLKSRLAKDIQNGLRTEDVVERSLSRLALYAELDTVKIDVSRISAGEAAEQIAKIQIV